MVPVIVPVIDIVEAQKFRTTLAIVVRFTRLQRAYNFERKLQGRGGLSFNKGERMCQYFSLRTSRAILVVVEAFLDLIESQVVMLSVGSVKNSTFGLIEMHLIKREWDAVFVVH